MTLRIQKTLTMFILISVVTHILIVPLHSGFAQPQSVVIEVIKWSPSGTHIAFGYSDGTVKIWNLSMSEVELTLEGQSRRVHDIAWSPDGQKLVAGGSDTFALIWDTSDGAVLGTLAGFAGWIVTIGWNSTGDRIFSFEGDGSGPYRIWDAGTYQTLSFYDHPPSITTAVLSPTGLYVGLGNAGGSLSVNDGITLETIVIFDAGTTYAISWSPDSSQLVSGELGDVQVWDWMTGQPLFTELSSDGLGHSDGFVRAVTFSADGQRVASTALDGTIRVWDWTTGQLLADDQLGVRVTAAAWSPDGQWLAYGSEDGSMSVVAAPVSLTCAHAVSSGDINQLVDHIESINASGIADTICLSPTSTQTFTTPDSSLNALPIITGDITIEGNGATLTRDPSADPFRFFEIAPGGSLTLNNLTLSNGAVDAQGGAILNNGTLTINDSTLTDNYANHSGGAIYNNGTLTLTNTTLHNNATYRAPDTGAAPLVGCEEAIYTTPTGTLTLINSACTSPLA